MSEAYEYEYNTLPRCPHCGAYPKDLHDGDPCDEMYDDGGVFEMTCRSCRKEYVAVTSTSYSYSTAVDDEAASDEKWGPQEVEPDLEPEETE